MPSKKENKNARDNAFGEELRFLRHFGKIKYSQSKLAKLSGLSIGYISLLERGDRKPSKKTVRELSRHLNVDHNRLFMKLGWIEMDLVGAFANNQEQIKRQLPSLSKEQIEEVSNYLTYLGFRDAVLK